MPKFQQVSFDELAAQTPLHTATFVVVDLETTGATCASDAITEIGAVKVRGGTVLGEFGTLVKPPCGIPPAITVLTGITDQLVAAAPPIAQVLPAFLEFAAGTILVAHNAPFDTGFLKAACAAHGYHWPNPTVVDTVQLARRILTDDEVPNRKLATLARLFATATQPNHRALDDARATVDVLHGLLARVGNLGVHSVEELVAFSREVSERRRRKRYLADDLPHAPGVYIFRAADDRPLYVGTSRDIAARVRSYFSATERRGKIGNLITATTRVEAVVCAHRLEAQVRELRIIAAHKPPFNRVAKYPERASWLRLTAETFPRLSLVRRITADQHHLGPFSSQRTAELVADAITTALPLRTCTARLSTRRPTTACIRAELGRCGAPCENRQTPDEYGAVVTQLTAALHSDPAVLVNTLLTRARTLACQQRFEDAASTRDRLTALLRAIVRQQRRTALLVIGELTAARRNERGGWDLAVIRHGRLAAAGVARSASDVVRLAEQLRWTAETTMDGSIAAPATQVAEAEKILSWLELPGTRLVHTAAGWAQPVRGAARWAGLLQELEAAGATGLANAYAGRR